MKSLAFPEIGTCSICSGPYENWGNNPWPLGKFEARCCSTCNDTRVVPARLLLIHRKTNSNSRVNDVNEPTA